MAPIGSAEFQGPLHPSPGSPTPNDLLVIRNYLTQKKYQYVNMSNTRFQIKTLELLEIET